MQEQPLARGLQEGEIRQELQNGGHLRNVLIISKTNGDAAEHLAYVRPSWRREFLPLRTWGDKEDRSYKDLDRLLTLLRDDFGYHGFIGLYMDGDPDLARYRAVSDGEQPGEKAKLGQPQRPEEA
jgi:hypothetical protein